MNNFKKLLIQNCNTIFALDGINKIDIYFNNSLKKTIDSKFTINKFKLTFKELYSTKDNKDLLNYLKKTIKETVDFKIVDIKIKGEALEYYLAEKKAAPTNIKVESFNVVVKRVNKNKIDDELSKKLTDNFNSYLKENKTGIIEEKSYPTHIYFPTVSKNSKYKDIFTDMGITASAFFEKSYNNRLNGLIKELDLSTTYQFRCIDIYIKATKTTEDKCKEEIFIYIFDDDVPIMERGFNNPREDDLNLANPKPSGPTKTDPKVPGHKGTDTPKDTPIPGPKGTDPKDTPEENKNKITFVFSSGSHKLKDGVENNITITLNNLILPKTKDEIIAELTKLQYKFDGNNPENIFNNNFKKENIKFVNESKEEIKEDNISIDCKLEIGNNCFNEKALEENKEPKPEDPNKDKEPKPKEKGKEETPNDFETPNNETPTEGKQENKKPSKCKCSGK